MKNTARYIICMIFAVALVVSAVFAQDFYEFTDRSGRMQSIPTDSFATGVVEYTPGKPWTSEAKSKIPENVLGEAGSDNKSYTLGAGGTLTVEFGFEIADGDGDDIFIFEVGDQKEAVRVEVTNDLENWYEIGVANGGTTSLDMKGKIPEGQAFKYVRLTDMKNFPSGTWPGADIDAIAALGADAQRVSDYIFKDRNGKIQRVPDGEYSFATRVVEFIPGSPAPKNEVVKNPDEVLGKPNYDEFDNTGYLTMGGAGVLVVEFNINITDGEGDDIYIFEIGPMLEDTRVEVSSDLNEWFEIGIAKGSTAGMDMNGKIPEGKSFRYVRLTDLKESINNDYPGADIDAVAGLNVRPVTSQWAESEIDRAFEYDIVPEILEHAVLDEDITRLEFAALSVKVYENISGTKATPAKENPFVDCADEEMLKAYALGITTGISPTEFAPDRLLSREQAATMLTRVFKRATIEGWSIAEDSKFTLNYEKPAPFADDDKISDYAKDSVYFMAANGIINGVGNNKFAPQNTTTEEEAIGYANATREQALIIAVRMVENLK